MASKWCHTALSYISPCELLQEVSNVWARSRDSLDTRADSDPVSLGLLSRSERNNCFFFPQTIHGSFVITASVG